MDRHTAHLLIELRKIRDADPEELNRILDSAPEMLARAEQREGKARMLLLGALIAMVAGLYWLTKVTT